MKRGNDVIANIVHYIQLALDQNLSEKVSKYADHCVFHSCENNSLSGAPNVSR